jgi:uroporphyrinogen III methyltransferase/synthase
VSDIAEALCGLGGAAPLAGVLHVVAVPRFAPMQTSLRAAVVVAGADLVRVPAQLPPDALAALCPAATREAGGLEDCLPEIAGGDRVVVQLVPAAMQTAPALVHHVERLREAGVLVEVVPSTGTVEGALVLGGVGAGIARDPGDGRLDVSVLAADRPDLRSWRSGLTLRGYLGHTPVRLITAAGTPRQRVEVMAVSDLTDHQEGLQGPVVAVVGDDVSGPEPWTDDLPLRGLRVLNPRADHQAARLSSRIRALGGEPVEAPLLSVGPGDLPAMAAAVRDLAAGRYELLALTSRNGVDALADALRVAGLDARALAGAARVACVGPGTTARLQERLAVTADMVPATSTTAALAAALGAPAGSGHALLARADIATAALRDGLREAGWQVDDVTAYRTVVHEGFPPGVDDALADGSVPVVPVLSSSMARALVAAGRARGVRAAVVSIGPVTSETLRGLGVTPYREAERHDLDGLLDAIVEVAAELPGRADRD